MKRVILSLALAFVTVFAFAQTSSILRPRMEVAEVEVNDGALTIDIFYMNDESPRTYWLSLGNLGVGTDIVQVDFDPVFELFIPLGNNLEEAVAKMEELKALYKMPRLEKTEIQGSFAALYPKSDELVTVTITSRRFIFSKILEFSLPTGSEGIVRATHISRSNFRSLLSSLKIYKALHPKD